MSIINSPAPRTKIMGIMDEHTTPMVPSVSPTAFSNMLAFTFAKKGPVDTGIWATGSKLVNIFGPEVVDLNNEYTTHQTIFTKYANSKNNPIDIVRVVPSDIGPKPTIGIWAEYVHDNISTYQRDPITNDFILDANGEKIKTGEVPGIKIRFFKRDVPDGLLGKASSQLGSVSGLNGQSKIVPLFEFQHNWLGQDGNDAGIRIFPAFSNDDSIAQVSNVEMEQTGFPFRFQVIRRTSASINGNVVTTAVGQPYVEGSFQKGAIHPLSKANYDLFNLAQKEYYDVTDVDAPVYPEIGNIKIYDAHVKEIFDALNSYINMDNAFSVNPFTGVDFNGIAYDCYETLSPTQDVFKFNTNTTAFLTGGSDGTLSNDEFNKAVRRFLEQVIEWDEHVITNIARHPYKLVVDSGYSYETKNTLIHFALGIHKACALMLTPQDIGLPVNDEVKDAALIRALSTKIASYPESSVTGATRALIVGRCGELINTTYQGLVPVVYAIFTRVVDMFGSPTGLINVDKVMHVIPNKLIGEFSKLSYDYQGFKARQRDWDNGAVVIEPYDDRQFQIPAYKSVYSEPTSILTDFGNVLIAIDCMHQLYRTWQDLAGVTGLTSEQLVDRANEITQEKTPNKKYADLVVVTANNYLDSIDLNNKYSWHANIILQGSVPARNAEISVTSKVRS